jgi:hypothetical protein
VDAITVHPRAMSQIRAMAMRSTVAMHFELYKSEIAKYDYVVSGSVHLAISSRICPFWLLQAPQMAFKT